jgi:hypothetical protein
MFVVLGLSVVLGLARFLAAKSLSSAAGSQSRPGALMASTTFRAAAHGFYVL